MGAFNISESDLKMSGDDARTLNQTLAISYYNLAVEQEHINDLIKARISYTEALDITVQS